jgi:SAM-dependent methyltransferase
LKISAKLALTKISCRYPKYVRKTDHNCHSLRTGFLYPLTQINAPRQGRLSSCHYRTLINSLDQVDLPDNSVDGIVSLAGLHHIHDRRPVYHEWLRLLKPGGRVVVGDVSAGTGTGEFLNTFVNQHTPGGHEGIFIEEDEFRSQLADTGFNVCEERLDDVPWQFPDQDTMGRFCKKLFSIVTADTAETVAALKEYIGISVGPEKTIQLAWQLRYVVAIAD